MTVEPAPARTYEIQGRTVTMPVEVRRARSWAAQFLVDARAAHRLLPSGLEVARPVPGRAVLVVGIVCYDDTDLDAYNEVAVSLLVRPPGSPPAGRITREFFGGDVGVHILHLPVTQTFTLEAGRTIWGYPKTLAQIEVTEEPRGVSATMVQDDQHVLTLEVKPGGPLPVPNRPPPTYSVLDGTLVRTDWDITGPRPRARPGGSRIELGTHAIADQLRTLGLPKRPLATQTIETMRATFAAPEPVTAPART